MLITVNNYQLSFTPLLVYTIFSLAGLFPIFPRHELVKTADDWTALASFDAQAVPQRYPCRRNGPGKNYSGEALDLAFFIMLVLYRFYYYYAFVIFCRMTDFRLGPDIGYIA